MADEAAPTHLDYGLYRGTVTNNVDAAKMGRVRVHVKGVYEPDVLCECVMPGSPFNQGMFTVPAVGADVLVGVLQGEHDSPVVLGGFVPPVIAGGSRSKIPAEDLPRLLTIENEDWRIVVGQKDTQAPFFSIESQLPGDDVQQMRIVIDMSQNFCLIEMPHGIELKTPGLLALNGRLTQIRERPIGEGTEPI